MKSSFNFSLRWIRPRLMRAPGVAGVAARGWLTAGGRGDAGCDAETGGPRVDVEARGALALLRPSPGAFRVYGWMDFPEREVYPRTCTLPEFERGEEDERPPPWPRCADAGTASVRQTRSAARAGIRMWPLLPVAGAAGWLAIRVRLRDAGVAARLPGRAHRTT